MEQLEIDYVPVDCEFVCVTRNGGVDYYKKSSNGLLLRWKKSILSWRKSTHGDIGDLYMLGHKVHSLKDHTVSKTKCPCCNK